jgi:predicted DNA-binding transcriptional regulator AlpA
MPPMTRPVSDHRVALASEAPVASPPSSHAGSCTRDRSKSGFAPGNPFGRPPVLTEPLHCVVAILEDERIQGAIAALVDKQLGALEDRLLARIAETIAAQPTTPDSMMSERAVADLFGCVPRTIRTWEKSGQIPHSIMFGGFKRWRSEEIRQYIAEQASKGERVG